MLVIEGFFCIPLPFFSLTYRRAIQARKRVTEALHLVVRERRIEREKGVKKNDMLAALFDREGDDVELIYYEIVDFLVSLLVAGYDTTSTTMTLAVKYLTDTPSALAQLKDMTMKFGNLDKFEGSDFRRWQKKMHFLLTALKVAYVLSTPRPEFVEEETLKQTRKQCKWDN
ncbi:steroid 23-alpha-hydroxylase cytochrome P450, partial [Tanacetum coccineum]